MGKVEGKFQNFDDKVHRRWQQLSQAHTKIKYVAKLEKIKSTKLKKLQCIRRGSEQQLSITSANPKRNKMAASIFQERNNTTEIEFLREMLVDEIEHGIYSSRCLISRILYHGPNQQGTRFREIH